MHVFNTREERTQFGTTTSRPFGRSKGLVWLWSWLVFCTGFGLGFAATGDPAVVRIQVIRDADGYRVGSVVSRFDPNAVVLFQTTNRWVWDTLHPSRLPHLLAVMEGDAVLSYRVKGVGLVADLQISTETASSVVSNLRIIDDRGSLRGSCGTGGDLVAGPVWEAFGQAILDGDGPQERWSPEMSGAWGEWFDRDMEGYELRQRLYHPDLARWTSRDPFQGAVREPATLSPYHYARQDPVTVSYTHLTLPTTPYV